MGLKSLSLNLNLSSCERLFLKGAGLEIRILVFIFFKVLLALLFQKKRKIYLIFVDPFIKVLKSFDHIIKFCNYFYLQKFSVCVASITISRQIEDIIHPHVSHLFFCQRTDRG